jgi:hypothetical protein
MSTTPTPAPDARIAALAEHLRSISAITDTTSVPVEQRAQLVADSARRLQDELTEHLVLLGVGL